MVRLDRTRALRCLLTIGLTLLLTSPLYAQRAGKASIRITAIEIDNFPEVSVYVSGKNLSSDLAALPITLQEDGKQIEQVASAMEVVGTQTAVVLDASGSIRDPGQTGDVRYLEAANLVQRLVDLQVLTAEDWLAAFVPAPDKTIMIRQTWTRDHQAVANSLYSYQPPGDITLETPLFELLYFALDNFDNPSIAANTSKAIVLLSDGESGTSSLQLNDAIDRAVRRDIPIHTILLGPGTDQARQNMERLATLTGGYYVPLTALEVVDPLWTSIGAGQGQRVLTYRTQKAQPNEIRVSATLADGNEVVGARAVPSPHLQPVDVEVEILAPNDGISIQRRGLSHDTPLEQIDPQTVEIRVHFRWPDGRERNLTSVIYGIGSVIVERTEAPFDQIEFPIRTLDTGNYPVQVIATDEVGLQGQSQPLGITIDVIRPEATFFKRGSITIYENQVPLIISFSGLGLGILALAIALRNPERRKRATERLVGAVKTVTERLGFGDDFDDIKAVLVVESPGHARLATNILEIRGNNTTIGRSSSSSDIVIDETSVSGLHCRFEEEADETLRLLDEGSTNGTFVGGARVPMEGYVLKSNEVIRLGPRVRCRFYYYQDYKPVTQPTHITEPQL